MINIEISGDTTKINAAIGKLIVGFRTGSITVSSELVGITFNLNDIPVEVLENIAKYLEDNKAQVIDDITKNGKVVIPIELIIDCL